MGRGRGAAAALTVLASGLAVCASPARAAGRAPDRGDASAATTLILYDDGALGEASALSVANLASRFGARRTAPVRAYRAGDLARSRAAVYIGSSPGAGPPQTFLEEVLRTGTPVLWIGENLDQLAAAGAGLLERHGLAPRGLEARRVDRVRYKGVVLTRDADAGGPLVAVTVRGGAARILATGVTAEGDEVPWAVRSGNLTYVAENPFTATSETDRYLVLCDLLFDLLAPDAPERHRALVRIEDVMPTEDPGRLRAIADTLAAARVPFAIAVVPLYVGIRGDGRRREVRWTDVPRTLDALRYMIARGGVVVMHGYTHERDDVPPRVSGRGFEFWRGRLDAERGVVLEGPVPGDGAADASRRARRGLRELGRAGLARPVLFEYPHYAGSAEASAALARLFPAAYQRGLYFVGQLSGRPLDTASPVAQLFPYDVTDLYGWRVLPENLGRYAPTSSAGIPVRRVADLVRAAEANRVVRDGFASFSFDVADEPRALAAIVAGVQGAGYTFVSPLTLVPGPHGGAGRPTAPPPRPATEARVRGG